MKEDSNIQKKKWSIKRIILISIPLVLLVVASIFYFNFNKLLSVALNKAFESSLVSEVYELKFENLRVNPLEGSISVYDVTLQPREKPINSYPYINSSFTLKTEGLILKSVDIMLLLKSNKLDLDRISITKPDIDLVLNGNNPIFFPFKDSTVVSPEGKKKTLDSYLLDEFQLIDATFHVTNSAKQREFRIQNFSISLQELFLDQNSGEDLFFFKHIDLSLEKFTGSLTEGPVQEVSFSDFKIKIDSVDIQKNLDTLIYKFQDFTAGMDTLDIQTEDSLYHFTMNSFNLSYQDQSIKFRKLSFKPNVKESVIQKKYKYQHTQFSGTVGSVDILKLNFDSLIYGNKIFIDEIVLDSVSASIYKDKRKPMDMNHFPEYLGQSIAKIKAPILIKLVTATNVNLTNEERKPDGTSAKVQISRATAEVKNITNLAPNEELSLDATAYLADKVKVNLGMRFSYLKPEFTFDGGMSGFKLADLNPIIQAYTPAKFLGGTADEIKFSGIAQRTSTSGTLKFLYHDLEVNLELHDQAKWKNSVITFGANTALLSNNPVSPDSPDRVVKFKAERDMNKGFVNVIIKSILNGMKETMVMSKENRHDFNKIKREAKRDAKKDAKKEKN